MVLLVTLILIVAFVVSWIFFRGGGSEGGNGIDFDDDSESGDGDGGGDGD